MILGTLGMSTRLNINNININLFRFRFHFQVVSNILTVGNMQLQLTQN